MDPLFLCVPNFSEGRDPEFLDAVRALFATEPDAALLGLEADPDHHRSVLSFAATRGALLRCCERLADLALERIDLRRHRGCHPRIGALDVLPVVPLLGTPESAALAVAHELGRRLARRKLPVFFYGRAARRKGRLAPARFRAGGFEKLAESIGTSPRRTPDLGPHAVHPSGGAVAVGVRPPLIALNFEVAADLEEAREAAVALREPGLVQALGFPLASRGTVQVSCNLLDHRRRSPRQLAERLLARGLEITNVELIGLAPALAAASLLGLALPFAPRWEERILEERLAPFLARVHSPEAFARRLADPDDTPGGGAAAALVASLSAALLQLVEGHSQKKRFATFREQLQTCSLAEARELFEQLREVDAAAYARVLAAYRRKKSDPDRVAAVAAALHEAGAVPARLACRVAELLPAIVLCVREGNPNLRPDAEAAGILALAAARVAALQVRDNASRLAEEPAYVAEVAAALESLERVGG